MTEERKMLEILDRLNIEYKQTTEDGNKSYSIVFNNPYHPLSAFFDKNGNCRGLILW